MTTSTTYVRDRFSTGPLPGLYARNHYMCPVFQVGEGEGSGGEGEGSGEGEGEGEGSGEGDGTGEGEGEGEGQQSKLKAHAFKDANALVMLPGFKKPIKVGDLAQALSLRDKHEGGLRTMGEIAKALKAQQEKGGGKQPQKGQPQQEGGDKPVTKDVLDKLESMDLLDGKSAAAVMREFRDGTVTPMLRAVVAMAKEMKDLKAHVGSFRQRDAETDFSGEIKNAIASLKLPRDGNTPIAGEDVLTEMARDLFFSYDEEDQPKLRGEVFAKIVKERHDAIMKYAKAYQKAELAAAQRRAKEARFIRPGASSSANGKPKKMLSNKQAAELLFAGSQADA